MTQGYYHTVYNKNVYLLCDSKTSLCGKRDHYSPCICDKSHYKYDDDYCKELLSNVDNTKNRLRCMLKDDIGIFKSLISTDMTIIILASMFHYIYIYYRFIV